MSSLIIFFLQLESYYFLTKRECWHSVSKLTSSFLLDEDNTYQIILK